MISGTDTQQRLHPCGAGGIQFACNIRDEEYFGSGDTERIRDLSVAGSFVFRAGRCIEVPVDKLREVTGEGAGEEQALREDAAGRKDANVDLVSVPARERRGDILKYFAVKLAGLISLEPDLSLNAL